MDILWILLISVVLQLAAAVQALRLIRITGRRMAWLLISAAVFFMAIWRGYIAFEIFSGVYLPRSVDKTGEWIGLVTSALMFFGVAWIAPLFLSVRETTEALRQSQDRYRSLFEDSKDAIFLTSREGRFLDVNQAGLDLFGYSRQELKGLTVLQLYANPDDRARFQKAIEEAGAVRAYETKFRKKNGTEIDCTLTSSVERTADGTVLGYQGIIRDVSELKRATELLKAERERLFSILNELPAFVDLHAPDHTIRFANRSFRQNFGDPEGRFCYEVLHGRDKPCEECPTFRVFETRIPQSLEWTHAKGLTYQIYHYPFYDVDGSLLVLELGLDITDRKRAEQALRESEVKYRELVENANSIIVRVDPQGRITFFNEFAERFFGYSKDEIFGRHLVGTIVPETEGSGRDLAAMIEDIILHPERYASNENENVKRNGERVWVSWTNRPLFDADGRLVEILGIGNDVTQRRKLEEQYRQSQKMEAVGRLAGGIAHDFNNLLTVIIGYSELLSSGLAKNDPLRLNAQEIQKAGERAASLTRRLLVFSRKQILLPRVMDLNQVIRDMETLLGRLIGEDIELVTALSPGLGSVKADPGQIEQVIMNLVVNARDAMPEGGRIRVETADMDLDGIYVSGEQDLVAGPYVMMAMSDTGVGIDSRILPQIFEPFFTTKEEGKGTGLGLPMVYGIVRQSGGHLRVFSRPGQGTTFQVYLPRIDEAVESPSPEPAPAEALKGSGVVLLAEDEESVRSILRLTLQSHGYFVLEASSGEEALQVCTQHPGRIDLLVTDVVMPGMNGPSLAERMACLQPGIRVLFLSGYTDGAVLTEAVRGPGAAFLQKPFFPADLMQKVRELLGAAGEA